MRIYRKFLGGCERRYQFIIRNVENFAEYVTPSFSYTTILILFFSLFCGVFGLSLLLARTVLSKWFNPIYIEIENQKKILSVASTVETLEQQFASQERFIKTFQGIIHGKSILLDAPSDDQLPILPIIAEPSKVVPSSGVVAEKAIRKPRRSKTAMPMPMQNVSNFLFTPINGMITAPFSRKTGHYGVDIVGKEKDPVKAVLAGIVIFSDWSVDTGWVIMIQHHNNFVSICKHCTILFKKVGNLVKAGDVVALMGNSGELSTGPHLHFELWNEGVALNPEDFIQF